MRLAIDVMGGDHAPDEILKGCIDALDVIGPDDALILVGARAVIEDVLSDRRVSDPRLEIEHAPDVVGMHEPPAKAVRTKPNSSIVRMAKLGSARGGHRADAVLSAGNTGACVSAAIMYMRRLRGVHRPGISVVVPGPKGPVILCDAGANPEPRATHLWQYALMGETHARSLGIENPRVAFMNIGAEEAKGTPMVREATELLQATPGINYIGYVEGRDFFAGTADVIATDGFVGNTILKMAEGLVRSLFEAIATELLEVDPELAMRFEPVVKQVYAKNDYHEYGGAPLVGVNGTFVIAHGSSQARTIRAAIRNTLGYVNAGLNEKIIARLEETAHVAEPMKEPA